jgi:purine-nucleoside phosphorylase
MSIHISAEKGEIAKVVLQPGDPLRAQYIAENYLENAKLVSKTEAFSIIQVFIKERNHCRS